jgi:hypothetical protein
MVRANSQHKCSSIRPTCAFPSSACANMSVLDDAGCTTAAAPAETSPQPAAEESDSGGEPTAAEALAPANGQAASGTEAAALLPPLGAPGGSSTDPIAPPVAPAERKGKDILAEIQGLKDDQKRAREAKKQITKDLRNAEKKRQRLKKRAKQLSDGDLLAVMTLRSAEQALRRPDAGIDVSSAGSADRSEAGTITPTSTTDARDPSQSPIQPKRKARTS